MKEGRTLEGRRVLVAGGTTGIGRATALLLAQRGARVVVFGRHATELNETLDAAKSIGGEVHGITADQSKGDDVERVFATLDEKLGGIDILINNAAISPAKLDEGTADDFRYGLETNLLGYITCTQQALKRMKKTGEGGHIVHIGSMSADLREEGNPVYVATKAGIQAFAESLRKSANKENILVSLIEPGAVDTDLQTKPAAEKQKKIEAMEMLKPEDIAECVAFCLTQPQRCDIVSMQVRPLKQII